jgi:hypothetical protein
MHRNRLRKRVDRIAGLTLSIGIALVLVANPARADEGGAGLWLPGLFGSFAATPGSPGWSLSTFLYHAEADASASKTFFTGGRIVAGLHARPDLALFVPTYTFAQPVLGGQGAVGVLAGLGHMHVSADATLTGPAGREFAFGKSDSITGGTDVEGLGTVKWQRGNHNYMAYALLGAPTGAYQVDRLSNLGLNHWSLDGGGAYTYYDMQKGRELSVVAGLTYNFENHDTHYRNGVDGHIDWALSQFLNERLHAGIAGYVYNQLSGDSGSGAVLGDFHSRTNGVGPQAGYFFPFGAGTGYVNLRGFWEFEAAHRVEGWNAWLTVALPLGGAGK